MWLPVADVGECRLVVDKENADDIQSVRMVSLGVCCFNNLIESVPRRIEALGRARGGATKY